MQICKKTCKNWHRILKVRGFLRKSIFSTFCINAKICKNLQKIFVQKFFQKISKLQKLLKSVFSNLQNFYAHRNVKKWNVQPILHIFDKMCHIFAKKCLFLSKKKSRLLFFWPPFCKFCKILTIFAKNAKAKKITTSIKGKMRFWLFFTFLKKGPF